MWPTDPALRLHLLESVWFHRFLLYRVTSSGIRACPGLAIDDAFRHFSARHSEQVLARFDAVVAHQFFGPRQGMGRQDHVVEPEQRVVRRRRPIGKTSMPARDPLSRSAFTSASC
jgi:hypothetical protein